MILSTQTETTAHNFGDVGAVKLLAQAGFDALDFTMFGGYNADYLFGDSYVSYIKDVKKAADDCGVYFNQAHAPFPSYRVGDEEYNIKIRPRLERSIEIAGMLGVKNIIIHPVYYAEDKKERYLCMYNELLPFAKAAGVRIALENMWDRDRKRGYIVHCVCSSPEEMSEYYDALDPQWFTVCLDIGHIGLVGEDEALFIEKLGAERLGCLHIHDNNYIDDSHMLPFTMKLDWKKICTALKKVGYRGDMTLESDAFLYNMPKEMFPIALKYMQDTGRHLIKLVEG